MILPAPGRNTKRVHLSQAKLIALVVLWAIAMIGAAFMGFSSAEHPSVHGASSKSAVSTG